MTVAINPGSGPVPNATSVQATANMKVFAEEVGAGSFDGPFGTDGDGRWKFKLWANNRFVDVEMPGISIEKVRYVDRVSQNIWEFPRLYVNGGSWVWLYAIDIARDALHMKEAEHA